MGSGEIVSFDHVQSRYQVQCVNGATVAVKPENVFLTQPQDQGQGEAAGARASFASAASQSMAARLSQQLGGGIGGGGGDPPLVHQRQDRDVKWGQVFGYPTCGLCFLALLTVLLIFIPRA